MEMLDYVKAKLQAKKGSWRKIAKATEVSYSWINHVSQGHITDPRISRIQRLFDYFKNEEREELFIKKKREEFRARVGN